MTCDPEETLLSMKVMRDACDHGISSDRLREIVVLVGGWGATLAYLSAEQKRQVARRCLLEALEREEVACLPLPVAAEN